MSPRMVTVTLVGERRGNNFKVLKDSDPNARARIYGLRGPSYGRCVSLLSSNPCRRQGRASQASPKTEQVTSQRGFLTYKKTHPPRTLP